MNLAELALTTFTEAKADRADTEADLAAEARSEFLQQARKSAAVNVCQDAADLDWQYVTGGLPDQVEEARAILAPGRVEYLRYRIDESAETVALELVQPRAADRITAITSLFQLGMLLDEQSPETARDADDETQDPGPFRAVEQAARNTARVAAFFHSLHAQHPGAGLTADTVSVFGHRQGDGSAELHLSADGMSALRSVAATLSADVVVRHSEGYGSADVLEHGTVTLTVDGINVTLRAYAPLPENEATSWRIRQAKGELA